MKIQHQWILVALIISVLGALDSKYELLAATLPQQAAVPVEESSWHEARSWISPTTLQPIFPDKNWWEKFNDPKMTGYISAAFLHNPGVRIALDRIAESRALLKQSVGNEFPSLNFKPSAYRIGFPNISGNLPSGLANPLKLFVLPLQVSYELDLWGKNLAQIRSARKQVEATEMQSLSVLNSLSSEVASAYINLLRMDSLIRTEQENLVLLQRVSTLKKSQRQAGLIAYEEVLRADRNVARAETSLIGYRQQQAVFSHELSILTGSPPASADRLERSTLELMTLPRETEAGLPSELLTRRPDIRVQEKLLQSARIDVSVARKAFLPTINLGGSFVLGSTQFNQLFNWKNFANVESATVNQPVFKGGKLFAELDYRKARQKEQMENYRQTVLNAFKDVEDSLAFLRQGYESSQSNGQQMALTKKELELTQDLYRQGLTSRLNVLQAESELIRYRQQSSQSKADTAIATVSLFKALGGGY